jgi:hypothetical protein
MAFVLYLAWCVSAFGLINLAPLFALRTPLGALNAKDLLVLLVFAFSLPAYLRQRAVLGSPWFRWVEALWTVFAVLLAAGALRSPAASLTERFVQLRATEDFYLFYPSVAILTTFRRLRIMTVLVVVFAVFGTALTLAQSLHGTEYLFDSPFYDIGAWNGNRVNYGGITRVDLPVIELISYTLLGLIAASLLKFRAWYAYVAAFLLSAVVVNFARSLWLALAIAIVVEVWLLVRSGHVSLARLRKLTPVLVLVVLAVVAVALSGRVGLTSVLTQRIADGFAMVAQDTGTWGNRFTVAQKAMELWSTNPLWGVGQGYYKVIGDSPDLGYAETLVTIGVVGLGVDLALLGVCAVYGARLVTRSNLVRSPHAVLAGVVLAADVVLQVIDQEWIYSRAFVVLAVAAALAFALPVLKSEPTTTADVSNPDAKTLASANGTRP